MNMVHIRGRRIEVGAPQYAPRLTLTHNVPGHKPVGAGLAKAKSGFQSKRRRRFSASLETAGGDGVLFLHRRRQSIFLIDAAQRAAASLFSIVTQDGQRRIFQRSQPTAPKRHVGVGRRWERRVGRNQPRRVHTPNKSRFSLGRHSRFFGQGPKKWGGIALGFPSERTKQGRLPILPGEASCTS